MFYKHRFKSLRVVLGRAMVATNSNILTFFFIDFTLKMGEVNTMF